MSSPKLQTKVPSVSPSLDGVREFEFTERDFEAVRKLIYQRAGISLSAQKMDMVYSRLARRLRATGMKRFEDYLAQLRNGGNEAEWEAFTNALTTNLTSFFREQHHFPVLAEHLAARRGRQLVIWCCASSTGEEPYSLAMTAVETFGSFDAPVSILATDVDTNVLRKGEAGVYPAERVERVAPERVRRFFQRGTGAQEGQVRVRPELQRMVTFRRLNLLDAAWTVRGPERDDLLRQADPGRHSQALRTVAAPRRIALRGAFREPVPRGGHLPPAWQDGVRKGGSEGSEWRMTRPTVCMPACQIVQ
jgi:chemotaxis protein methyltransferase CheR